MKRLEILRVISQSVRRPWKGGDKNQGNREKLYFTDTHNQESRRGWQSLERVTILHQIMGLNNTKIFKISQGNCVFSDIFIWKQNIDDFFIILII